MLHRSVLTAVAVMLAAAMAAMAQAPPAEPEDVKMTVDALKQRNRDLERRLTELESKMGASAEQQAQQREEIRKLIDQTIAENKKLLSPDWMENLKFSGDLRLRYEFRRRESGLQNDESRARFRLPAARSAASPSEASLSASR
jgi:hypothetical protein